MNTKPHWEHLYETKVPTQVSWYQEHAQYSLQFIQNTGVSKAGHIIDKRPAKYWRWHVDRVKHSLVSRWQ